MKVYLQILSATSALASIYTQSFGLICVSVSGLTLLGLLAWLDYKSQSMEDAFEARVKLLEDKMAGFMIGKGY